MMGYIHLQMKLTGCFREISMASFQHAGGVFWPNDASIRRVCESVSTLLSRCVDSPFCTSLTRALGGPQTRAGVWRGGCR